MPARHRHSFEQQVPVNPFKGHLAEVIQARFAQQRKRSYDRQGIFSGNRLHIVVEIEQERLAISGFDEAVSMTVELQLERLAFEVMKDVFSQPFRLKMRNLPSFLGGQIGGVAENENVLVLFRLQRVAI